MLFIRYKGPFLSVSTGVVVGLILLMFNVFLSFFNDLKLQDDNMTEMHSISNFTIKNHEHYIPITLSLFGFDNEYISNIKGVNTSLSLSEDIKVRIVAKADIGALNKTRIEIIRAKESSYIDIEEGTIVNGLLIKEINDKTLVVENNGIEHVITLFHPKDINLKLTENNNDN